MTAVRTAGAAPVEHFTGARLTRRTWEGRAVLEDGTRVKCGHTGHRTRAAAEACVKRVAARPQPVEKAGDDTCLECGRTDPHVHRMTDDPCAPSADELADEGLAGCDECGRTDPHQHPWEPGDRWYPLTDGSREP